MIVNRPRYRGLAMLIGVNLSSNTRIYRRFISPNPLKKGAQDSSSPFFKGSQRGLGGFPHE